MVMHALEPHGYTCSWNHVVIRLYFRTTWLCLLFQVFPSRPTHSPPTPSTHRTSQPPPGLRSAWHCYILYNIVLFCIIVCIVCMYYIDIVLLYYLYNGEIILTVVFLYDIVLFCVVSFLYFLMVTNFIL